MNSSTVKLTLAIDGSQYGLVNFNAVDICMIDEHHVAVVVLGKANDVIFIFSTDKSRNIVSHEVIDEDHITSIAVNGDSVYVGFETGQIARVNKKHLLKGKFLREMIKTQIQTALSRPVLAIIFDVRNVLVASGRFISQYPLEFSNRESDGLIKHLHLQQRIDHLVTLPGARQFAAFFQCAPEVHIVNFKTFDTACVITFGDKIQELNPGCGFCDRRVTSMCFVYDVLWLGTGSGHIFIYDVSQNDKQPQLLTVFQPYKIELRKLCLWKVDQNQDEHGVEYLVVSTGKELNPLAFAGNNAAKTLCWLTGEVPVEIKCRSLQRKSPTPTVTSFDETLKNPEGKVILMWHAADAKTMRQYLASY
jgi:hypothetical protein